MTGVEATMNAADRAELTALLTIEPLAVAVLAMLRVAASSERAACIAVVNAEVAKFKIYEDEPGGLATAEAILAALWERDGGCAC